MSEEVQPVAALAGRRALVTGAVSGIGMSVTRRLTRAGCDVVAVDRVAADATALVGEDSRGSVTPFQLDLTDSAALANLVAAVGRVDILVNNAGVQHVSPLESFPPQRWEYLLELMLTVPFRLTSAFLPGMYASGWGRVINVASVHGLVASPFKAAYVAAKHGLVGLTKVVALEAAEHPGEVTAHAVCPSYVRTPLVEAQLDEQAAAHGIGRDQVLHDVLLSSNAVKRLIEPDEVAQAVLLLCGPLAWSMTGSAWTLDAGWLAH